MSVSTPSPTETQTNPLEPFLGSAAPFTNVKRYDCGSSAHHFKRSIIKSNEFKTYVNTYPFDLIFSLCSV